MSFYVRELQTYDDMIAVHQLQQDIWQLDDASFGLYPPVLYTASKYGGVVLGAFNPADDTMIAFIFSVLGREPDGLLKLHSQTMGVKPAWRGQGVAEALKLKQRTCAQKLGLTLITWTVDPLEGANANLNLHKLGAVTKTYMRNYYGEGFGSLNAGLPTDRFLIEWWLDEVSTQPKNDYILTDQNTVFTTTGQGPELEIIETRLHLLDDYLFMQIPENIQKLKEVNLELALDWRLQVRAACDAYFPAGYQAVDFISRKTSASRQNFYVLKQVSRS